MTIRHLFLAILIFTGFVSLTAADTAEEDSVPDSASDSPILREVDSLIAARQYLSAWTLLHDRADQVELGNFIVKKTELTLLYYSKTSGHQLFSFDDLAEDETLLEVRQESGSAPDLKLFDPAGALNMVLDQEPERGDAWLWLGEYYFQVMTIYGDNWQKPASETGELALGAFRKALSLGEESEKLYSNSAYCELMTGDWEGASEDLKKALEYDGENGEYYYNLGLAALNLQNLDEALEYTERAVSLMNEGGEAADALFLESTIHLYMGNENEAENTLIHGTQVSPRDYRFPDRMIRLSLSKEDYDGARGAASLLMDLYPDNPENLRTIVQYFYDFGKLEELLPFFSIVTEIYSDPEILGNIYFHLGLTEFYLENNIASKEAFEEAEKQYSTVFPADHQVFEVIKGMAGRL